MPIRMTACQTELTEEISLVHAAKAGDMAAFEELVARHTTKVFRTAMHILRSHEEAEDVVQEAFLQAFKSLHRFEERSRFSTWVSRIAINAALSRLRGARRAPTTSIDFEISPGTTSAQTLRDWNPNPEQLFTRLELKQILQRALASLPESYRVVFLLRDVEELSIADTAETLGLSVVNVKVRLFRARLKLREYLNKHFAIDRPLPGDSLVFTNTVLVTQDDM